MNDAQKPVLTVVLWFDHPSIDPGEISACLQMTPSSLAVRGAHYVTVTGASAAAIHRRSKWMLYRDIAASDSDVNDAMFMVVRDWLSALERSAAFVRELGEEGLAYIGLKFAGAHYRGFVMPPEILARASALNLGFGIEVFPGGLARHEPD